MGIACYSRVQGELPCNFKYYLHMCHCFDSRSTLLVKPLQVTVAIGLEHLVVFYFQGEMAKRSADTRIQTKVC